MLPYPLFYKFHANTSYANIRDKTPNSNEFTRTTGKAFLMITPSCPKIPTVVVPKIILLGEIILPIDPPAVCAARMTGTLAFKKFEMPS